MSDSDHTIDGAADELTRHVLDNLIGRRIRLTSMPNDPDPIPLGTTGTVRAVYGGGGLAFQLSVDWDIVRSLLLIVGTDTWEVLS